MKKLHRIIDENSEENCEIIFKLNFLFAIFLNFFNNEKG